MTIYLIRHGKTMANEKHLYCGATDIPLSKAGREELDGIRYSLENVRFLTSGMKRTEQTLQILFGEVPREADHRFREMDFGIFEMCSYDQLKDTSEYQKWLAGDNERNVAPGGESGVLMKKRVLEAFSEIREDTCIITHGGVIDAVMAHLFPNEGRNRYQWQPAPGRGYRIHLDEKLGNSFSAL